MGSIFYVCIPHYQPSKSDLENVEIKKLASQLRGKSDEETLTNVLEWQDRNITFWSERDKPLLSMIIFLLFSAIFFVVYVLSFNNIKNDFFLFSGIITLMASLIILGYILFSLFNCRKIPISKFWHVFQPKLSLGFLLKHKLSICPDYARLTACLLKNIYSDKKFYEKIGFVDSRRHVSTGIWIDRDLYMLDQKLPIKKIKDWQKENKSGKNFVYLGKKWYKPSSYSKSIKQIEQNIMR